jgi:hypothetical protein
MKRLKSQRLQSLNNILPSDAYIELELDSIGYNRFVPYTFLADLLIIAKYKLLYLSLEKTEYVTALSNMLDSFDIKKWVTDVVIVLKEFSTKYNLREFEEIAIGADIDFNKVSNSFNYKFDLKSINSDTQDLLDITESELKEFEEMDEEVINILTLANGNGNFFNNKAILHQSKDKQMTSYGDITKIKKHKYADPLFKYRYTIKSFNIDEDTTTEIKTDTLIIGIFLSNWIGVKEFKLIMRLLGVLALQFNNPKIIVYDFITSSYNKYVLDNKEDIIQFFKSPMQLKIFPVANIKMIDILVQENPGSEIIFLPNPEIGIETDIVNLKGCRINMISIEKSKYNQSYKNICSKTGGNFTIV